MLVQVALAAVKSKDCPYFNFKYNALSKRRGKKRAVIAIARMILTSVFHMLSNNVPFNSELYADYYRKASSKLNNISMHKLLAFLSEKGFSVIDNETGQVMGKLRLILFSCNPF